jgi:hypothetical protein
MLQRIAYCPLGLVALLSAALLCAHGLAWADRGSIRAEPVNIEEPAQRAIIVHNGVREWLILQTDVRAEKTTRIVEFMPLPSKPEVSLAPEGCFAALKDLVEKHKLRYGDGFGRGKGPAEAGELVQVVVSAQLGPHAVTVAEVKDSDAFVAWVHEYFRKNDLGEPAVTSELREVVADYLRRDLRFFAFDIVTLSPEKQTVQPLTYEFRSDKLYYPLVVTNLYGGGQGTVELFTIVPQGLAVLGGREEDQFPLRPHPTIEPGHCRMLASSGQVVMPGELDGLHSDLPRRLGAEKAWLTAYKYEGPLRFERDVCIPLGYTSPEGAARCFFWAWANGNRDVVESLVETPFALAGSFPWELVTDREGLLDQLAKSKPSLAPADFTCRPYCIKQAEYYELADRFGQEFVARRYQPGWDAHDFDFTPRGASGDGYRVFVQRNSHGFNKVLGFMPKR